MKLAKTLVNPCLLVCVVPFILFAPIYLSGRVLFWGTPLLQFGPWWSYAWESLQAGHLPLWNPLVGMGAPLLANYQSALFYPPTWIYFGLYVIGGAPLMAWGMAPIAALHLAWAGLGMVMLTRRIGLSPLAQTVSGLGFCLSGYLVTRLNFLSINAACAWIPWILLFLTPKHPEKTAELAKPIRHKPSDFQKLTLSFAALLVTGHAQTAWYAILLVVIWAIFWGMNRPVVNNPQKWISTNAQGLVRIGTWLFLACLLAMGIAAIQLLPTAEYLMQSQRASAVDYEYALNYSFWPWHLVTLVAPGFFGSPKIGDYWGFGNFWEDALYIGVMPFLLALLSIISSFYPAYRKEGKTRIVWLCAGLCIISLLFAMGRFTPVYPWLYHHVPTFRMFQAPSRWLIWFVFSASLLAGIGIDRLRRPVGWGLYWARLATMGAFAITLGGAAAWLFLGEVSPSFIRSSVILGFLGFGVGLLCLWAPPDEKQTPTENLTQHNLRPYKKSHSRFIHLAPPSTVNYNLEKPYKYHLWQEAVTFFVIADLLIAWWGITPGEKSGLYGASPTADQIRELTRGGRVFFSPADEDWLKYQRFLRFDTYTLDEHWQNLRAIMLPNANMLDNIAVVNNYDPLVPSRFSEWMSMYKLASDRARVQMLGLMDARLLISRSRLDPLGVKFRPVEGSRLRWVECKISVLDGEEAHRLILGGEVDFDQVVIVEDGFSSSDEECLVNQSPKLNISELYITHKDWYKTNRRIYDLEVSRSGWLVVSETWFPGWIATVDSQPVTVSRANFLFQAIKLTAGKHHVVFEYQPLSFRVGASISLVSIIVLVLVFLRKLKF